MWGLFFGLKLAIKKGIMDIVIDMDSIIVVNFILSIEIKNYHPMTALISNCKRLLHQIPRSKLQNIYREKNTVTDNLVAWSHNIDLGCWFIEECLNWLGPLLMDGSLRVTKTPHD